MYVEALIGRDTVDTIPPATMDAFRDHGEATPDVIEQDVAGARAMLAELQRHRVSLQEVTEELIKHGVQQFADAFDKLFGTIARRRRILIEGTRATMTLRPGSQEIENAWREEMEAWRKDGRIRQLWAGDKSYGRDRREQMARLATRRWTRNWPIWTSCAALVRP